MTTYTCNSCGTTIDAEDHDDLIAKGWHVLYAGSVEKGTETILCPRDFERGATISPKIEPLPEELG